MALPSSRSTFKQYCLRKLGAGVIQINVSDDQVDDRVDEAMIYYQDWAGDATEKQYYKVQVTTQMKSDKYFTLPDNIIGAIEVFPVGMALSSNNLFNIRYQIALNDLYDLTSVSMVPYFMAMQHIQFLEELLVGMQPLRYNRRTNRLYLDMDWNIVNTGDYLVVTAYQVVDPDTFTKIWSDRWLINYATALIKENWGNNLKKFKDIALLGGQRLSGQEIYDEAKEEITALRYEMEHSLSIPPTYEIG